MSLETSTERDLVILEHIEQDPDITQADMASRLEVAVGTINWHLKRLIEKGYVKVSRAERKKLSTSSRPKELPCARGWLSITSRTHSIFIGWSGTCE